jgi:hypothetical protein
MTNMRWYSWGMRLLGLIVCGVVVGLVGCHSAYVEATVVNKTDKAISLVEVDYPSASFGTQTLAAGASYHYRFKVLGSGALKLIYTDAAKQEQHADGPSLHEGDEGGLVVSVTPGGVKWDETFVGKK